MTRRGVEEVIAAIVEVAAELGKDPSHVSRRDLLAHSDVTWRDLGRLGGLAGIKFRAFGRGVEPDLAESRGVALSNNYTRSLERRLGDSEYLAKRIENLIARALKAAPPTVSKSPRKAWAKVARGLGARRVTQILSDLHIGHRVDEREVPGGRYGYLEAGRSLAYIAETLADWKPNHRDETELEILLGGDLVEGAIHAVSEANTALLAEQGHAALWLLVEFIDFLRDHYTRITVHCYPGNHGRWPHRNKDRAVSAKWDGFDHLLHLGLQLAFRGCADVRFNVPRTPYILSRLPGETDRFLFATHGDTVISVGNPGRMINLEAIAAQAYRLEASAAFPGPIDIVAVGHVHAPTCAALPNGAHFVANGALIGATPYGQANGYHSSHPAQIMFESVAGSGRRFPVGDFRIIFTRGAHERGDLDEVIRPLPDGIPLHEVPR